MAKDTKALKKRVQESKLTKSDKSYLLGLVEEAEEALRLKAKSKKKLGNRKIIAQLPHGMDIVK